ncbi:unnamed protein product [Rotaria sordida]|uniref:Uncharacterized protein n=1 Tax=Rotaria sordida TaxID=392033 RepID=A0A814UKN6_9BILA|nr:unnamed protein product [Rotaria sordida]CAF3979754.1 unnamed protein product [Rotaria sordida]
MFSLSQRYLFDHLLTFDDLSKKSQYKNIKFKRAFEFLQLLFLQRVYGIDIIKRSPIRQLYKQQQQQQYQFEVFLGGSCNPTTWRHEQAIPYFQLHSVAYYNPQVANWTPDLVEIEHNAKESARLLFFVIDHDTRSLAAIAEVCYLIARERTIIVIITPMPEDKYQTKFIQQKNFYNEQDNENDYENVCQARETLRILLRIKNVPVFDNVKVGLECAGFLIKNRKQSMTNCKTFDEEKTNNNNKNEKISRSSSNKISFESPDNFYRKQSLSEMTLSPSVPVYRRHSATSITQKILPLSSLNPFLRSINFTTGFHYHQRPICTKTQISCSTNESDDDGYGSLISSNRTLSRSASSCITSDFYECSIDHQFESNSLIFYQPISILNIMMSIFSTYISFVCFPISSNLSITQSIYNVCTVSYRFINHILFSFMKNIMTSNKETIHFNYPIYMFDLYIASGDHDEIWLNTYVLPILKDINVKYIKRQTCDDNDQLDLVYNIYVRKRSRLLYYLINNNERLSNLVSELAYLIGERKYYIIVYLQSSIDENSDKILTKNERQDIERSRKYLEDLAIKENILLFQSREQSCQHVLAFFLQNEH